MPSAPGCHDGGPPSAPIPPSSPDVLGLFPAARAAPMSVAIVDYGSGNLHSAAKAFEARRPRERPRPADCGDARP